MSNFSDDTQYANSQKLSARADMFKRFGSAGGGWHLWVFDRILESDLPPDASIVDVGGGPGWLWQHNQVRIPEGWRVTHTDLSPGMVAEARNNVSRQRSFFGIVDAHELPTADASVDALVANHMLYHVKHLSRVLAEFVRVLKPGGYLFATTNGEHHMAEIGALVAAYNRLHGQALIWPKLDFTLESGKSELDRYFKHVELHRCQPGLMRVTEAAPLAACITSVGTPDEATREHLTEYLREILSEQPTLNVHTQSGMFRARK